MNDWRQNYAQWVMQIGRNSMDGGGTGTTTTPPGLVGQQYMGQPQSFNGNALMQPQSMGQDNPFPPPMLEPNQGMQQNAIWGGVNRMFG